MRRFTEFLYILLIFAAQSSAAGVLSPENKHLIVEASLEKFWGNARRSDGSIIAPKSEVERSQPPIAEIDAYLVVDVGEISSFAERCKLDWKSNLFMLTGSARKSGLTEKQIAYIAVLHGFTMGLMENSLAKIECNKDMKTQTASKVEALSNKSINFAPSAPDTLPRASY